MDFQLDTIYNEDCLEGMKQIPDGTVDAIITDLPYDVLNDGNPDAQWDKIIPLDEMWEQFIRVTKPTAPIVLFGSGMFTAKLMMSQPTRRGGSDCIVVFTNTDFTNYTDYFF